MRHNKVYSFANVTKLFSLVIICHILLFARADAEIADNDESSRSVQESTSDVGKKLFEIRRLLKQLFFEWNLNFGGESDIAGKYYSGDFYQ
jgi:hypothetical protein